MAHVEGHDLSLGIGAGVSAFVRGIGFIIVTPRVWLYALVPMAVMCFVGFLLSVLFVWAGVSLTGWVLGGSESTWVRVGVWILNAMVVIVSLLIAAVVALSVAQPLSGFALDAIAHAQEFALTGKAPPSQPFFRAMLNTTRIVMLTLAVGGTLILILIIIGLLFPPAAVITVPLKFIICAWLLAWDFLDYPMGLRGMGLGARLRWVRRNLDAFTMFGICWAILIIVPGIVLFLLPMGVAGATRMMVEDERREWTGEPT